MVLPAMSADGRFNCEISTSTLACDPFTGPPEDLAMPKSMMVGSSSGLTMMLAGFRSRWTTPAS